MVAFARFVAVILATLTPVFPRLLCALFAGSAAMVASGDDAGFNAPTQSRNASAALRRYGAVEALSAPKAVAIPYAKNLQLEADPAKPACAQAMSSICNAPVPAMTTLQFELTPLREAMPETARLKPKSVYIRRHMIVVAYTFK